MLLVPTIGRPKVKNYQLFSKSSGKTKKLNKEKLTFFPQNQFLTKIDCLVTQKQIIVPETIHFQPNVYDRFPYTIYDKTL